jgi:hypothetical protein
MCDMFEALAGVAEVPIGDIDVRPSQSFGSPA